MISGSSFNSTFGRRAAHPTAVFTTTLVLVSACAPRVERLHSSLGAYPADGTSGGVIHFERGPASDDPNQATGPNGDTRAIHIIRRETTPDGERIHFRSTRTPGTVTFAGRTARLSLRFLPVAASHDQDGDGFPDAAELITAEDRRAFRAWFVRISQSQFMRPSMAWHDRERDCSGLIRFAYKEALKRHDRAYQERAGIVLDKNLPDVRRFQYPAIPIIGRRLFRVRPVTSTKPGLDPATDFAPFATAEVLMKWNTRRVGDDLTRALPGDILFFLDDRRTEGDFHSMIVTAAAARLADARLIYHTGGDAGLKRVTARYLLDLRDPRFRPIPENPRFLGVFRFLILD